MVDEEREQLFEDVLHFFGAPVRTVELTKEQMCSNLNFAIQDVAEKTQNFIIEANWANLYGKDLSNLDLAFSLSVRTFDMTQDFSDYFSKQVGLQQHGKWELKKDFFVIEEGKQSYHIPAGREINKVLFITPPTTDSAMYANYFGGGAASFGGGVTGQVGAIAAFNGGLGSGYGIGMGAYALPIYDVALTAIDMKNKNKFLQCDLVYKVTGMADGSHIVHLLSTPGGYASKKGGFGRFINHYCWYTYYETPNADECRKENKDILLSPDMVPLSKMEYEYFNEPTKAIIRKLFVGLCAKTLALIRGKFSGRINMIANELTMDYAQLMTLGNTEYDAAMTSLKERLERLSPYNVFSNQAQLVENLIKIKKGTPLTWKVG